jgi:hypothetical protein
LAIWGLALLSILFSLGLATHSKLYSTVQLPGACLVLVEVLLTDFKNWLQTENRKHVSEEMSNLWGGYAGVWPQTVFIELLPQQKT